jgi:hypothetical protein
MTEAQWLSADRPHRLLAHLRRRASDRKLWLLACGLVRRLWHILADERSRQAVEAVERWADGLATDADLASARQEARAAGVVARAAREAARREERAHFARRDGWWERKRTTEECSRREGAAWFAWRLAGREWKPLDAVGEAAELAAAVAAERDAEAAERAGQVALVREVFGNPFRPVPLDPAWLAWHEGTIPRLARATYDNGAFDRLPVLADALEEAGCTAQDVLRHCRQQGGHTRGCWALDLVLAKE